MRTSFLLVFSILCSACHPWFKSGPGAPDDQQPEITSETGYVPGTPPWVPVIDACMANGGTRGECIESLPPEMLEALESWEREIAFRRRALMRTRQREEIFGGKLPPNDADGE